jgi:hypothetical protein
MSDLTTKLGAGALIAGMGYVAKLLLREWFAWRRRRERKHAQLLQLSSLLKATAYAYSEQVRQREKLYGLLSAKNPVATNALGADGYEQLFSTLFKTFVPEELELHTLVRGLTIHALRPSNLAMSKWLALDTAFRTHRGEGRRGQLAAQLNVLANHLLSWNAKYEMWIPNNPEHALVYLADEKAHGVGFPNGIEDVVNEVLSEY